MTMFRMPVAKQAEGLGLPEKAKAIADTLDTEILAYFRDFGSPESNSHMEQHIYEVVTAAVRDLRSLGA